MLLLVCLLLCLARFSTPKCSLKTPRHHEQIYLCRETINATTVRIRLHIRLNISDHEQRLFSYYKFTLRTLDLLDGRRFSHDNRLERTISDDVLLDSHAQENHTIVIQHLFPGRYEICADFLNRKKTMFFRTVNSCLYLPWNVPAYELAESDLLLQVPLLVGIILLLLSIMFAIHAANQCIQAGKIAVVVHDTDDGDDNNTENETLRRLLFVTQRLGQRPDAFQVLMKHRVYQRYAHHSPDLDER
jgi:hypothetical protein